MKYSIFICLLLVFIALSEQAYSVVNGGGRKPFFGHVVLIGEVCILFSSNLFKILFA